MKIKITIFLFCSMPLFLCQCSKESVLKNDGYLEQGNKSGIDTISLNAANSILDEDYGFLRLKYYYSSYCSYYFVGNFASGDGVPVGSGPSDQPSYHDIYNFRVTPENTAVQGLWLRSYHGIYQTNKLIYSVILDKDSSLIKADARFIRAYLYFELVRYFKNAVINDTLLESENDYAAAQSDVSKVFAFIVSDLQEAIKNLPSLVSKGAEEKQIITKWSAKALLGKTYLYMASPFYNLGNNYYQQAINEFKDVENSSLFSLLSDYDQIWKEANEFGSESVFEISYYPSNIAPYTDAILATGNIDVQFSGPRFTKTDTIASGWGFDIVSEDLIQSYDDAGDNIRKKATALSEQDLIDLGSNGTFVKLNGYTGYFSKKRAPWYYLNRKGSYWQYYTNERIIRYSDVLLMLAEAYNRNGNDVEALKYINQVRNRVSLPALTSGGESLYSQIKNERKLELAMEGHRFFDLVRWKDAAAVLSPLGFVHGRNEVFPVPQSEIINSFGKLIQNPEY
jgi:starch-binding outer membrane protein, SusD/RagB family